MPSSLFDTIRESCANVAAQAESVSIHPDEVKRLARALPVQRVADAALTPEHHYLGHGAGTLNFIVVLDSINFGSGYSPIFRKRPSMGFYFTTASALKDYYETNGPPSAQALAEFSSDDCYAIFNQDKGDAALFELMEYYAQSLRALGRFLLQRFGGSVESMAGEAGHSAEKLAALLRDMPFYRDVSVYRGLQVPFLKRAQILASDLALAFDNASYGRFDDLDNLTMFADNGIPQILEAEGVLSYAPQLRARIERRELIAHDSPEEVEIRACALHAVELIAAELKALGTPVPPRLIDYYLWLRRQEPDFKSLPSHLSRCVFY